MNPENVLRFPSSVLRLPSSVLCLFFCLLLASGCGRSESNVGQGNRTQVLHRGIGSEPADLDPHLATNIAEIDLASALLEGLVAEDPVDLHPVPGAAESWEALPDQVTYGFTLRADGRWSDGRPVTAQDFVDSWRRMLTPALGAANATMLYALRGAEAFHKGQTTDFGQVGAVAVDARTLRVTLMRPTPHFLTLLSHPAWFPVPLSVVATHGSPTARGNAWTRPGNFVGNGPFTLKSWDPNQRIVVEKSATYWDAARVRLNAIHFHPIDSREAEERAFRTGQLHVTYTIPAGRTDAYREARPPVLRTDPYLDTFFLRINVTRPALDRPAVRQALGDAIDRDALVAKVLRGGQVPARSFTPPGLAGYIPPPGRPGHPERARQLLAEAGFPGGNGLPALELLYPNSENLRVLAEALQEMWRRELGIEVRLVSQEFKVVLASRRARDYQILLSDWVGDYLEPSTFLDLWRGDSGNNHTGWSDPAYDALMARALAATDPVERNDAYRQAEARMLEQSPIIPLYFHTHGFLLQPSVRGWNPTLLDHHPYKHVWLER